MFLLLVPTLQAPAPNPLLELLQLEAVWNEAHLKADTAALDKLWAEELVITVPGMDSMKKQQALDLWKGQRIRFSRYETSDVQVRFEPHTATVTGRMQRTREVKGRPVQDDWRFTKAYVKRDGRWQVTAFAATPRPS